MTIRFPIIIVLVCVILVSACASVPKDVPSDLSSSKIIQRAQEASDKNKYRLALGYYNLLLERFPNNWDLKIAAEYEIAFIHYKKKRYEQAKKEFNSLLDYYSMPDAILFPQQFKILSGKLLTRIEELQTKRKRSKSK